jgi:hypothetical protein
MLMFVSALALLGGSSLALAQTPAPAPDNSGVNVRDRNPASMTAGQQSNAKADVELTQRIRRAVMQDESLSMTAHNVKIISANGAVTLRGRLVFDFELVVDLVRTGDRLSLLSDRGPFLFAIYRVRGQAL